jgi:transglutaminase-like putative cysteine protease
MTAFRVTHRTAYQYPKVVSSSHGQMHLFPRDLPGQVCHGSEVAFDPAPSFYRERSDYFGNRVAYFEILEAHRKLSVSVTSAVDVEGRTATFPALSGLPWEAARLGPGLPDAGDADALAARQFRLDSPLSAASEDLAAYGRPSFPAGRPVLEALTELSERIYADFAYTPGATSVRTSAAEVLEARRGVCQDFAHLAIGCLRSLGMAARYVSGYLETDVPPGVERTSGRDVSHAWASAFVPGAGWVDLDPTNHQLVDDRYITTAWGRDYSEVPPLKGVIYTKATTHDLEVEVDVERLPA